MGVTVIVYVHLAAWGTDKVRGRQDGCLSLKLLWMFQLGLKQVADSWMKVSGAAGGV